MRWFPNDFSYVWLKTKTNLILILALKPAPCPCPLGSWQLHPSSYLGIILDYIIPLIPSTQSQMKFCWLHLQNLSKCDHFSLPSLLWSLGTRISHWDYCNAPPPTTCLLASNRWLLTIYSPCNSQKIPLKHESGHGTPVLKTIWWLPVDSSSELHVLSHDHKALPRQAPCYISVTFL